MNYKLTFHHKTCISLVWLRLNNYFTTVINAYDVGVAVHFKSNAIKMFWFDLWKHEIKEWITKVQYNIFEVKH